jgi:hypothetical protein
MHQLFRLYGADERMEIGIPVAKKVQLIVHVAVNGGFDRSGANPHALSAQEGGEQAENEPTIAPQRHDPAGPCVSRWHRSPKQGAMIDFVFERLLQKR